eukprot:NODE_6506_length_563_cov_23.215953_g6091_i0.p2 GENE.NODE_6506_length_563_cov_23.215953_g6091_i0~~NODE_6506_length_563_cov_23.215953_g6091_i0.p2  ORF type:complete len:104 (+),score=21.14 NODE_6506_length_563_cov_23.215953_g6091_i0:144-455(+)
MASNAAVSAAEKMTCIILLGIAAVIALEVSLFFFAVLESSAVLLYCAVGLMFLILLAIHGVFRNMCTFLTIMAYSALIPSAFYLYFLSTSTLSEESPLLAPLR